MNSNEINTIQGSRELLESLGRPWTMLILLELGWKGTLRFGELREAVTGISARILTERLRELENAGLILRTKINAAPPRVDYTLTESGKSVFRIVKKLAEHQAVQ